MFFEQQIKIIMIDKRNRDEIKTDKIFRKILTSLESFLINNVRVSTHKFFILCLPLLFNYGFVI